MRAYRLALPIHCKMFPLLCFRSERKNRGDNTEKKNVLTMQSRSIQSRREPKISTVYSERDRAEEEIKEARNRREVMASKVANISDIIQRCASSCLTNPLVTRPHGGHIQTIGDAMTHSTTDEESTEEEEEEDSIVRIWEEEEEQQEEINNNNVSRRQESSSSVVMEEVLERVKEMEGFMSEVFDTVSAVKRAYVSLQEAHCPWDPERMRAADASVVTELRKLGRMRDRFRRNGPSSAPPTAPPLREVVAPYEAALQDLKKELRAKEAEIDNLKDKLQQRTNTTPRSGSGAGRKMGGRLHSTPTSRVACISSIGSPMSPTSELFEICMEEVKSASKSFTANLLSLMRSARWDIVAAARSIIDSSNDSADNFTIPSVDPRHAKHALESYINRKIFCGFENETFYIEGSLSSLLNPSEFRRECYARFRDMRTMDPSEILGILPSCQFGKFSAKKFLSIVHPKMEESLFGGVEQRRQVLGGVHPRTGFYVEFLRLAKAVWLLHLLAFGLEPSPSHFEASKGAEFHPEYMESVVRFSGGRVPPGSAVGFSVGPGFKLGNGTVVRARVYLVSRA